MNIYIKNEEGQELAKVTTDNQIIITSESEEPVPCNCPEPEPPAPIPPATTLYEYGENAPSYMTPSGLTYPPEGEPTEPGKLLFNRSNGTFYSNHENNRASVDVAGRKLYADSGEFASDVASWSEGIFNFKPKYISGNPTVNDVPVNTVCAIKNTATGESSLCFNDAGTIKKIIFQ